MAMQLGPGGGGNDPEPMIEINTTPLIDVMLVLLIMLIVTIPLQTHSVNLDLPNGPPPVQAKLPEVVRVDIAPDGAIAWNGEAVAGRDDLEARLRQVAVIPDQPELHLRAHKDSAYRHAAMVLASAQRLGVVKLGIVGSEAAAE